jgi:hypothetical protein
MEAFRDVSGIGGGGIASGPDVVVERHVDGDRDDDGQ